MNTCKSFLLPVIIFFLLSPLFSENKTICDFVIYTAKGERCIFSEIIGKTPENGILIINFTSIDCKPCRKELPELREIAAFYSDRVKLICIYSEAGKPVQELARSLGVLHNSFVDPFGKSRELFSVKRVPFTFLVNKKSRIVARFDGYTEKNMNALRTIIKEKKYEK